MRLLVATRNPGKVRELRAMLTAAGWEAVGLEEAGVAESPEEDALEAFETFEENARAKARYFAERTGLPALADDSGLEVDALGGAPGVRSRRFAVADQVRGERQDEANNRRLLELLAEVAEDARAARFVCAAALARPGGGEVVRRGTIEGRISRSPRGDGGFGYDPIFLLPDGRTLAEAPPEEKNAVSHRAGAVRALLASCTPGVDGQTRNA